MDMLRHHGGGVKKVSLAIVVQTVPENYVPGICSEWRWD